MFILFGILCLLVAAALILAVVVQNSKGGGLSSSLVGGNATQMLGARRSSEMIEKITWYLAAGLAVFAFVANVSISSPSAAEDSLRIESAIENTVLAPSTAIPSAEGVNSQVESIEATAPEGDE
ncbi:MAG: preprotein translocase subunit SecG [Bacteroidota bacterium]